MVNVTMINAVVSIAAYVLFQQNEAKAHSSPAGRINELEDMFESHAIFLSKYRLLQDKWQKNEDLAQP